MADYVGEEEVEAETYVHGSPRVALNIQHPFTEYILVEKSSGRIAELKALREEYAGRRNITILEGDANRELMDYLITRGHYDWNTYRAIVFLDPFGMQMPWSSIERLGQTNAIEIILNLRVGMVIQRLLPKSGSFTEDQKKKLNIYFGSDQWEDVVYEKTNDLFGST